MNKIEINNIVYNIHPIYDLYASDENGEIIHIIKKVTLKGHKHRNGYMQCVVRKYRGKQKTYFIHRFIWECFNGLIPEEKVIDHINNIRDDNRLCNLQLLTQKDNCKKSAKNRDYKFVAENHKNKKCVKAINIETNEVSYYNSMYAIQQHLGINAGIVKMACEDINNCKTGKSKKDGKSYNFEYIKQDELPDNYLKSANKRPRRVSDEYKKKKQMEYVKKWQHKEYKCLKCGKILKNGCKYIHNKICV